MRSRWVATCAIVAVCCVASTRALSSHTLSKTKRAGATGATSAASAASVWSAPASSAAAASAAASAVPAPAAPVPPPVAVAAAAGAAPSSLSALPSAATGTMAAGTGGATATGSTAQSQTASATGGSSASGQISFDQFKQCVAAYANTSAGGTPAAPSQDVYSAYVQYGAAGLSLGEQVQMLANAIWETAGLAVLKEDCSGGCSAYGNYYGRGYLQLSYQQNYQSASSAIFSDSRLVSDPDQVATPTVGWQTANWFWKTIVSPKLGSAVQSLDLGPSVQAINGPVECTATCGNAPKNRLAIYNGCLKAVGISGTGTLSGCCS